MAIFKRPPGSPSHAHEPESLPGFYYFANSTLRHLLFPICRVNVTVAGQENVPPDGPLIVVFNHISTLDPPLLGTFIPRDIVMMSKIENFYDNPVIGWMVRNYGAFPIRRGMGDVGAIRKALQVLRQGRALLISPEGTRSRSGQLGQPHEGVSLIGSRSGAPVLPVGISGIESFTRRVKRWRQTNVTLNIGRPFRLVAPAARPSRGELEAMSRAVMQRIALQLPASYQGAFGAPGDEQRFVEELGQ
jgi:1-acyl-sn-glycerol-3-phosphate acyltransferase